MCGLRQSISLRPQFAFIKRIIHPHFQFVMLRLNVNLAFPEQHLAGSSPVASMSRTTESATLQFQHWRQAHSLVNGISSFSAPILRAPS